MDLINGLWTRISASIHESHHSRRRFFKYTHSNDMPSKVSVILPKRFIKGVKIEILILAGDLKFRFSNLAAEHPLYSANRKSSSKQPVIWSVIYWLLLITVR